MSLLRRLPIFAGWHTQLGAEIDTVSGTAVTSDGYRESLQAAVDAAHLR